MEEGINVIFDKIGNTLDVWFGNPKKAICEETEEGFLIKKDIKQVKLLDLKNLMFCQKVH